MAAGSYYTRERLRSSGLLFLVGKALTAPLGIWILYLIAAVLSEASFAFYVWLLAFGEIAIGMSYLGLNWVALNYIPDYRVGSGTRSLRRLILVLAASRAAILALMAAICLLLAPHLVAWSGQGEQLSAFRFFIAVLVIQASVQFLLDCVFAPLLKQGAIQGNVLLRHVVLLAGLQLFQLQVAGAVAIDHVLQALLLAETAALALALYQAARMLTEIGAEPVASGDQPTSWRRMVTFAGNNYAHDTIRLAGGGSLLTTIAAPLVGVPALAIFGFARNLIGQLSRMLPGELFLGLLRPSLIAAYRMDGKIEGLSWRASLITKISNAALGVVIAVFAVHGKVTLGYLSDGKYVDAYAILLLFLLSLALASYSRLLVVVSNALERADLVRRAAFASLIVLPSALLLAWAGLGPYGLAAAIFLGELAFVVMLRRGLRSAGCTLAFDWRGHARIAGAMLGAGIVGALAAYLLAQALPALVAGSALMALTYVALLRLARPFDTREREAIERLLGRRVFLL